MKIDHHHLLECILWPNGDGTFRKIVNRAKRLEELGIYDDIKMTIPIEHNLHISMHREFEKGTEYERTGEKHPMYGITGDRAPMHGKGFLISGKKNGMYGMGDLISGEKNPNWKGDEVNPGGAYQRAKKLYKAGKISEEEFQPYRDLWSEEQRRRRSIK